jgi:hypothetical protein
MRHPRATPRFRAVARRPNDLPQESLAPEDAIAKHLRFVNRALIQVKPHRSALIKDAPDGAHARLEPRQVSVERRPAIVVRDRASRAVPPSFARAERETYGEWRIEVRELHRVARDMTVQVEGVGPNE